ncbi:MAG: DinB family protein [Anaerolineales bacterium]|nr:DinB family protein [Anaerolineales bacterium]
MLNQALTSALDDLVALTLNLPDAALDINWGWRDYIEEGIRFAFFRTYEELLDLSLAFADLRAQTAPITTAQRILGQYHAAYLDLRALCLGVSDELAMRPPADEEWPAQNALAHLVGADLGFYGVITFALEKHRAGTWTPDAKITDAEWDRLLGLTEAGYEAFLKQPFVDLENGHREWHVRILREFSAISEAELALPSKFWEKTSMPIRFRLGRFNSHLRQHTIQIEKTLLAVAPLPNEAHRLNRLLHAALAEVDAALLGTDPDQDPYAAPCHALAQTLTQRHAEIAEALISQTSA